MTSTPTTSPLTPLQRKLDALQLLVQSPDFDTREVLDNFMHMLGELHEVTSADPVSPDAEHPRALSEALGRIFSRAPVPLTLYEYHSLLWGYEGPSLVVFWFPKVCQGITAQFIPGAGRVVHITLADELDPGRWFTSMKAEA